MPQGLAHQQRIIKGFILVCIAGLIAIGSFSGRALALTFDPVQNLSATVTGSAYPQIVAGASNIYVVWEATVLGQATIVFRRSTDTGLTWSPTLDQAPLNISANVDSIAPIIGASGSNVFILWQANTSGSASSGGLLFRRSTDGGNSFIEPIQDLGATPFFAQINHQMVVLGTAVYVVWQDHASPFAPIQILFRRSTDSGSTWDPPLGQPARVLSASSFEAGLAMVASGQYVYVAWEGVDQNTVPSLLFRRSSDGSVTFEPTQTIAQNPSADLPKIVTNGSNISITGEAGQSVCTEEVIFRRSTDNGATWNPPLGNPPVNLSMLPGRSEAPQLYIDGSTVYVVWLDRLDGTACDPNINPFDILFRRSTDGGVTWDPPLGVPALSLGARIGNYEPPRMTVNGTNLDITWLDNGGAILFRHSPDGGTTWDPPLNQPALNLSLNLTPVLQPQIAVAGANTYVIWSDGSPGTPSIFFRRAVGAVASPHLPVVLIHGIGGNCSSFGQIGDILQRRGIESVQCFAYDSQFANTLIHHHTRFFY